jgi:proteasome lid subunit RPN8/RPN11
MRAEQHGYLRPQREVDRVAVPLSATTTRTIRQLAAAAHPRETGGLLLGWWDQSAPIVCAAVEVPDSHAGRNRWTRHEERAATALAAALAASVEAYVGYVGEWHSHPLDLGPSSRDISELRRISRQYPLPIVLAVARRRGRIDTRIAVGGRLTTPRRLAAVDSAVPTTDASTPKETA